MSFPSYQIPSPKGLLTSSEKYLELHPLEPLLQYGLRLSNLNARISLRDLVQLSLVAGCPKYYHLGFGSAVSRRSIWAAIGKRSFWNFDAFRKAKGKIKIQIEYDLIISVQSFFQIIKANRHYVNVLGMSLIDRT